MPPDECLVGIAEQEEASHPRRVVRRVAGADEPFGAGFRGPSGVSGGKDANGRRSGGGEFRVSGEGRGLRSSIRSLP